MEHEKTESSHFHEAQRFLLDPNVAILKAGAFKSLGAKLELNKIATNTHLYTTEKQVSNFPGRQFEILEEIKLKKGILKKANVICKNYPLKPEQIKAKYQIQEGGENFIIALSDYKNQKQVFRCKLV